MKFVHLYSLRKFVSSTSNPLLMSYKHKIVLFLTSNCIIPIEPSSPIGTKCYFDPIIVSNQNLVI